MSDDNIDADNFGDDSIDDEFENIGDDKTTVSIKNFLG